MSKCDGFVPNVSEAAPVNDPQLVETGHVWWQPPLRRCDAAAVTPV
jgi:hypothetical protein